MDEWEAEFGEEAPQAVGGLLREIMDGRMSAAMSANQRAALAWNRANGDRERAHTTGVHLRRSRGAGAAPVLCVYVDSHAMATDLGVNKDIYLARLANVGLAVSGIEFLPSREGRTRRAAASAQEPAPELPELDASELARVDELLADLPDDLRASVSKAVINSMRREKLERAKTEKEG